MSQIQKRPGVILAAAILLFVFGSYGLLGIFGAVSPYLMSMGEAPQPVKGQPNMPDPTRELVRDEPLVMAVMASFSVIGAALGGVKIWAGLGVLQLRPVGRKAGIYVAIISIVFAIVESGFVAAVYMPKFLSIFLRELPQELAPAKPFIELGVWGAMGLSAIASFFLWLTVILLLNRQRSRDAFAAAGDTPIDEPKTPSRRVDSGYGEDDEAYPNSPPDTGITERPRD